jgi:hypothetical protein
MGVMIGSRFFKSGFDGGRNFDGISRFTFRIGMNFVYEKAEWIELIIALVDFIFWFLWRMTCGPSSPILGVSIY